MISQRVFSLTGRFLCVFFIVSAVMFIGVESRSLFAQQIVPIISGTGQAQTPATSTPPTVSATLQGNATVIPNHGIPNNGALPSMQAGSLVGQVPPPGTSYRVGGAPTTNVPVASSVPPDITVTSDATSAIGMTTPPSSPSQPLTPLQGSSEAVPQLGARIAKISQPSHAPQLPNEQGQIWREYDITPYTTRPTTVQNPEKVITSWILRQSGESIWHSEPFGFMAANREKLVVYHTPNMQQFIADIVDRFVNPRTSQDAFSLRIVSLYTPDWRNKARQYLRPIAIQTPGVQGWLISKDHIGLFTDMLSKRNDFREHVSAHSALLNGQTTVVPYNVTRSYIRDVQARTDVAGGYVTDPSTLNEGYRFEVTPLLGLDGTTVDVMLKCEFMQIDKMYQLIMDTPTANAPGGRVIVEVPQATNFKVDEQIRWPRDSVLLLDLGMVPMLTPMDTSKDKNLFQQITAPITQQNAPKRLDVLILIESQGVAMPTMSVPAVTPAT